MEYRELGTTGLKPSLVGLGTWVMGGYLWGGADDAESLSTIRTALDLGINLIDTAPIYGHGRAEELVGRALEESRCRDTVIVATKAGLAWNTQLTRVWRDSSRRRVLSEVEDSLRRLQTDRIDIYQVHWPDTKVPFEETMETLLELRHAGKIRFVGVSNFDTAQLRRCLAVGPVHVAQPPYNLFERGIEESLLPFCREHGIGVLAYGPLCRGLLSGKYHGDESFPRQDIRGLDPKFTTCFSNYLACVDQLRPIATRRGKTVGQLAIRWCLDQPGVTVALCGARRPAQIQENAGTTGWCLTPGDREEIDQVVAHTIQVPAGPEFMAPP